MIYLLLVLSYYLSFFTKIELLWRLLYLNYNLVILEKTVKSLVCLFMTSVSLIQIFAICVGVYLTTSPFPHWLMWLECDILALLHLTSIWVRYWYIDDKNLHSKLMHSHYSHLHKRDYCLHCITDGFDVFSGFDGLYK